MYLAMKILFQDFLYTTSSKQAIILKLRKLRQLTELDDERN